MSRTRSRLGAGVATAVLAVALVGAPAGADTHRHAPRHGHVPTMSGRQRACLAQHGFGARRPLADLRDLAVWREFVAALRTCGVLPPAPGPTTTTTTSPPIITS